MPKQKIMCISCKKSVSNSQGTTRFSCPGCGNAEIVRCMHCREIAAKYTCHSCGFEGPN